MDFKKVNCVAFLVSFRAKARSHLYRPPQNGRTTSGGKRLDLSKKRAKYPGCEIKFGNIIHACSPIISKVNVELFRHSVGRTHRRIPRFTTYEKKTFFFLNVKIYMDEISKRTTKQGRNDTTWRCHNTTSQSSCGLPPRHLLTFYFCCGIVMDEEEEWRRRITMKNNNEEWHHITMPQHDTTILFWFSITIYFDVVPSQSHNKSKMSKDVVMAIHKKIVAPYCGIVTWCHSSLLFFFIHHNPTTPQQK